MPGCLSLGVQFNLSVQLCVHFVKLCVELIAFFAAQVPRASHAVTSIRDTLTFVRST